MLLTGCLVAGVAVTEEVRRAYEEAWRLASLRVGDPKDARFSIPVGLRQKADEITLVPPTARDMLNNEIILPTRCPGYLVRGETTARVLLVEETDGETIVVAVLSPGQHVTVEENSNYMRGKLVYSYVGDGIVVTFKGELRPLSI
jgi:hypothetical protein